MGWKTILELFVGIFTLCGVGFLLGLILSFVAKLFRVEIDPRIEEITNHLPGANCGSCGYPGCAGYGEALVQKDVPIDLCSPGGKTVIDYLETVLEKKGNIEEAMVAKIFCMGDDQVSKKEYNFNGDDDCFTVHTYFSGDKLCKYGCIGRGDCIKVCPVNAIKRDPLNRVWINSNLCIGCKKCLEICPSHVIRMVPLKGDYFVACSSHDEGKVVRSLCQRGCIGCRICEKLSPVSDPFKITVNQHLAVVSYKNENNTSGLQAASLKCPVNVIVPIKDQKSFVHDLIKKELEAHNNKKTV